LERDFTLYYFKAKYKEPVGMRNENGHEQPPDVNKIVLVIGMMLEAEKNEIEKDVERPAEDLAVPVCS
jgi:hypothetical protein